MANLVKSKTPEGVKNKWATNWPCFFDARALFERDAGRKLVLDVCAEPQTAKLNRYYLAPDWVNEQVSGLEALTPKHAIAQVLQPKCVGFNALQCSWDDGWWCNPPFDLKFEFLQKAVEEMFKGNDGIMLLPYEPLSTWWRELVEGYATMVYEPDGRYQFYEADGKTKKTGANFGSVFVLFTRKGIQTPRQRIMRGKYQNIEEAVLA